MQHVYYKGNRYLARPIMIGEVRLYSLYNHEGILVHFVSEEQLEKRTLLNFWIETYLRLAEWNWPFELKIGLVIIGKEKEGK